MARQAPIHPVVQGNKRDAKKTGDFFSAKKLFFAGRL
jgi:hypothetical protein